MWTRTTQRRDASSQLSRISPQKITSTKNRTFHDFSRCPVPTDRRAELRIRLRARSSRAPPHGDGTPRRRMRGQSQEACPAVTKPSSACMQRGGRAARGRVRTFARTRAGGGKHAAPQHPKCMEVNQLQPRRRCRGGVHRQIPSSILATRRTRSGTVDSTRSRDRAALHFPGARSRCGRIRATSRLSRPGIGRSAESRFGFARCEVARPVRARFTLFMGVEGAAPRRPRRRGDRRASIRREGARGWRRHPDSNWG